MLPIETIRVAGELVKPLTCRLVPQRVHVWLHGLGFTLHRWSAVAQAKLPEPLVICIKLVAAWILLPLIVLAFGLAPGIAKIVIGVIVVQASRRAKQR